MIELIKTILLGIWMIIVAIDISNINTRLDRLEWDVEIKKINKQD
jgi:hypothetical protein